MNDTPRRSRQFRRVSSDLQESNKQIRDLDTWDARHGYAPGTPYVQDDKSAYHGKHVPELERAIRDMENGEYDVLTFWASDRMWRGKSLGTILLYIERLEAVGAVEFVNEPHLNNPGQDPMVRNILFANAFGMSYGESKRKAERTRMDIREAQATGTARGRAAWGYEIMCRTCGQVTRKLDDGSVDKCGHKDNKAFVPTEEGRTWIPAIFQAVIEGKSLRDVARMLDQADVKPAGVKGKPASKWNEGFLGKRLIRNKTYMGQRPNAGALEVEALVSPTTWQEAQAALASRIRPGRATVVHAKPIVTPVCAACYGQPREGCPSGISPMYRVFVGAKGARLPYFRCTGHGPQRVGCGARMIPVADLEATVTEAMLSDLQIHFDRVFVPGDDTQDQIEKLRLALDKARTRAESNDLWDMIEKLEATPSVAAHWAYKATDVTKGEHFASLDDAGRREFIAAHTVAAQREADGLVIVSIIPRELTG